MPIFETECRYKTSGFSCEYFAECVNKDKCCQAGMAQTVTAHTVPHTRCQVRVPPMLVIYVYKYVDKKRGLAIMLADVTRTPKQGYQ